MRSVQPKAMSLVAASEARGAGEADADDDGKERRDVAHGSRLARLAWKERVSAALTK